MEEEWEGGEEGEQPGGSNKLQSMSTQANTGGVKNGLVNNSVERRQVLSGKGEWRVPALGGGGGV